MGGLHPNVEALLELVTWAVSSGYSGIIYAHGRWRWEVKSNTLRITKSNRGFEVTNIHCAEAEDAAEKLLLQIQEELRKLKKAFYLECCLPHVGHYKLPAVTTSLREQISSVAAAAF